MQCVCEGGGEVAYAADLPRSRLRKHEGGQEATNREEPATNLFIIIHLLLPVPVLFIYLL